MDQKRLFILIAILCGIGFVTAGWIWFEPTDLPFSLSESETQLEAGGTVKIEVFKPGLYRLTPGLLADEGLSVTGWDPQAIGITLMGEAVPIWIEGEAVYFYGLGPESIYASYRPYVLHLTADPLQRLTMEQENLSATSTAAATRISKQVRLEEDLVYNSLAYAQEFPDTWYWATIHVKKSFAFSRVLTDVADGSGRLAIHLFGQSHDPKIIPDHDLDLSVNGQIITTITWDGPVHHVAEIDLPPGTLRNGENEFLLDNRPDGAAFIDIMLFDQADLSYGAQPSALDDYLEITAGPGPVSLRGFSGQPLVFDISNPAAPIRLTGGDNRGDELILTISGARTIAAAGPATRRPTDSWAVKPMADYSDNLEEISGADLVIITTPGLAGALEDYVSYRTDQGLTVRVATTDMLFNRFGHGLPTPESIRNYLIFAQDHWEIKPRYVLLVGTSRYDYRDNLGLAPENQVPSLMVPVTHSGETVSDNRLADLDGDYKPDLAIGRWPVETAAEVADLARRTITYEQGNASSRALFTADGTSPEFTNLSDYLLEASGLPETNKLYGVSAAEVSSNWNSGSWLVSYVGHGSIRLWGKDELFSNDSIHLLNGSGQFSPPIVAQFTCLTGYYAHPTERSLSERLLSHEDGPVLVLGATSLTYSTHQRPFAERFLQGLRNPGLIRIGDVLLYAREELDYENNGVREVSDTFGLLGDPSAIIVRPSN